MSDEYNEGDVIRLNNTQQEGEILEVINVVSDEHHGPLLRVNLLDVKTPQIAYYPTRSVSLVRTAEEHGKKKEPKKKGEKSEQDDKAEHGKHDKHDEKGHGGGRKILT
jgi:hypothetical protein